MNNSLIPSDAENTIRITVEFFEDGTVLKSGRTTMRRCELDMQVRSDVTCDQFLAAIYCGLRQILTGKYGMDVRENLGEIRYRDRLAILEDRARDPERGDFWLRARASDDVRLRSASLRYAQIRKQISDLDQRYPPAPDPYLTATPAERERLYWCTCWQVFLECFYAYSQGYPGQDGVSSAQQLLSEEYRCHPVIARGTVNVQMPENQLDVPLLWLQQKDHGKLTLHQLGFLNGSRLIFDPVLWHREAALFGEWKLLPGLEETAPDFTLHHRALLAPAEDPVYILPPDAKPARASMSPLPIIVPSLTTIAALAGAWLLNGPCSTQEAMVLSGAMVSSGAVSALVMQRLQSRTSAKHIQQWCSTYEQYIRDQIAQIRDRQLWDVRILNRFYPPAMDKSSEEDLVRKSVRLDADIFSRRPAHWDFLQVRLGVSMPKSRLVPSRFPILGESYQGDYTGARFRGIRMGDREPFQITLDHIGPQAPEPDRGHLEDLPDALAEAYGYLENAPVLLKLRELRTLGLVVPQKMGFDAFLTNFLLDACFHHLPEHLQVIMLCPRMQDPADRHETIALYKDLPHFRGLMQDRSAFAFDHTSARELLERVNQCTEEPREQPHILVIAQESYGLECSDVMEELYERDGVTVLLCKHYLHELPECFNTLILANRNNEWYLLPPDRHAELERPGVSPYVQYAFRPDRLVPRDPNPEQGRSSDPYYRAFKTLGALYAKKTHRSAVPAHISLFETISVPGTAQTMEELVRSCGEVPQRELLNQVYHTLRYMLSSHWKTPGSGDLLVCVGADEHGPICLDAREGVDGAHAAIVGDGRVGKTSLIVQWMLGLCARFRPKQVRLHLLDMDGQLSRALGELPHAQIILSNGARLPGAEVVSKMGQYLDYLEELIHWRRQQQRSQLLDHCFVLLDDYDNLVQLLRAENSSGGATTRRLCRLLDQSVGLGMHIVVSSHSGLPLELLRRLELRLCLKVSNPLISQQMLQSDLATRADVPGRVCLRRLGTGVLECFQAAYSGEDIVQRPCDPFRVMLTPPGEARFCFFDLDRYQPPSDQERITFQTRYGGEYSRPSRAGERVQKRRVQRGSVAEFGRYRQFENHRVIHSEDVPPRPKETAAEQEPSYKGDTRPDDQQPSYRGDTRPDGQQPSYRGDARPTGGWKHRETGAPGDDRPPWYRGDVRPGERFAPGDEGPREAETGIYGAERPSWYRGDLRPGDGPQGEAPRSVETGWAGESRPDWYRGDLRPGEKVSAQQEAPQQKRPPKSHWREEHPGGKRYSLSSMGKKRKIRRSTWSQQTKRYFREPIPTRKAREVRLPRPDLPLLSRKPLGLTQAQCLVQVIRAYDGEQRKLDPASLTKNRK